MNQKLQILKQIKVATSKWVALLVRSWTKVNLTNFMPHNQLMDGKADQLSYILAKGEDAKRRCR